MFHTVLYLEIDIFCVLVLLAIMDHGRIGILSTHQRLFNADLLSVMVTLLLDGSTWVVDGATFPCAAALNYTLNFFYWLSSLLPCMLGMLYCICVVYGRVRRGWLITALAPTAIGLLLLLLNIKTGWIFVVSADNFYTRGPYFLAVGGLPFFHMAVSSVTTLRQCFLVPAYERRKYQMLTVFMLIPLLGSLMQIFIYGVITTWPGLTLSVLMCYVYIQNANLATDPLTGLNNRGRFDAYFQWLWSGRKSPNLLHLIILDIDSFKEINDCFGHAEGDAAVLKRSMDQRRGFLARIGGDEFAILLCGSREKEPVDLMEKIQQRMEEENRANGKPYRITFSMGYAESDYENLKPLHTIFKEADDAMYQQKKQHMEVAHLKWQYEAFPCAEP